ncbi:Na/Pi cotransporter family protein [Phaeovulum vinaykumarii]|uniref:Phosphate:Na+ symporter n=1 Tax=Phaeovulum vinaykumarii TaxID=407234 RepID=A0A1N7KR40_9RHOB|nr:Na/Pi symporter [Phaeovulum vinaykumarii]SIS64073.1 phosphate:Na+ symporter [Phaeovulum vinaykumarii]SOC01683.1 phosphate:Na+ symporter [Phaeovulum vinaykumarii]
MIALVDILGGIGLFILGMQMTTDSLRALAGGRTRAWIARFATTPLRGALTGAGVTAILQSSSAVVVTAVGFVGAGILSFPQAIGIIYGANIGTTITGWIVMAVGVKLHLGLVALGGVFVAALMRTLGTGRWRAGGLALAGISLVFVGFDFLQQGADALRPAMTGILAAFQGSWVALMLAGMAFTVVVQSSSAGVATALVLLGGGTIDLMQAAAMVVGMDVGTTFKSLLVTIGGSRDMRRTAVAHVAYNVVTGVVALALLGPATALLRGLTGDDLAALVAFHTSFNLAGVLLMLPLTGPFARGIIRLVPDAADSLPPLPDRALLADAHAALDAGMGVTGRFAAITLGHLSEALRARPDAPPEGLHPAIDDLADFLTRIALPEGDAGALRRHAALLHRIDHLHRLVGRAEQTDRVSRAARDPLLARPARALAAACARAAQTPADPDLARRLGHLAATLGLRARRIRRGVLLREHAGLIGTADVFALTDAARWLERTAIHCARIVTYGAEAAQDPKPKVMKSRG